MTDSQCRVMVIGRGPIDEGDYVIKIYSEGPRVKDPSSDEVEADLSRLPFRLESFDAVTVWGDNLEEVELLEINRVLKHGEKLTVLSRSSILELEHEMVQAGFSSSGYRELIIEDDPVKALDFRKTWRRYYPDICPHCGGKKILPLIPIDSRATKTWSVYCSSCSYNWSVVEPIGRVE
ncbi:MAG: hypothetical protein NZ920_02180 [Aigarchaeota archaeon]|nr:hypothetical protein [Aigarchaeota archaeon]MDW8092566.1 hypothetical protein [Nitrososphaerota archaeon]